MFFCCFFNSSLLNYLFLPPSFFIFPFSLFHQFLRISESNQGLASSRTRIIPVYTHFTKFYENIVRLRYAYLIQLKYFMVSNSKFAVLLFQTLRVKDLCRGYWKGRSTSVVLWSLISGAISDKHWYRKEMSLWNMIESKRAWCLDGWEIQVLLR